MPKKKGLAHVAHVLAEHHGRLDRPGSPLEAIFSENVGYLVNDERRAEALEALRALTGLDPARILDARPGKLFAVAEKGGMLPLRRVEKLLEIARIVHELGDLDAALAGEDGRRVAKRFPGFGDPGADWLLLLAGRMRVLAPESNALRVLVRLGYGQEKKSYAATYRSVALAVAPELDGVKDPVGLRLLLRRHGQEVCKTKAPLCEACPLTDRCRFFAG